MGDEKITPQAGDVWKHEEIRSPWFVYNQPQKFMVNWFGETLESTADHLQDGKNGWELVWREGWERGIAPPR